MAWFYRYCLVKLSRNCQSLLLALVAWESDLLVITTALNTQIQLDWRQRIELFPLESSILSIFSSKITTAKNTAEISNALPTSLRESI